METFSIFASAFLIVFIGELGDKTQLVTGTGVLANRDRIRIIFLSSALALTAVAGLTVLFAGLVPESMLPILEILGGLFLITYGVYLFSQAGLVGDLESVSEASGLSLFIAHFVVVFVAELGDKTQFATLGIAVKNQTFLFLVFMASASALISVAALTVWGVARIPSNWNKHVQRLGALLMTLYGGFMIVA